MRLPRRRPRRNLPRRAGVRRGDEPLYGDHGGDDTPLGWTLEASAYFYSFGRLSLYSSATLFDYDADSNSMRCSEPLTRLEAALSVVRLHDSARSAFPVTLRGDPEEDEAYLETVEARRQEILGSEEEPPKGGAVYYVSVDGSDSNDGLSPETPWAGIEAVNGTAMQPGDTVCFRRGDVFRGYVYAHAGVRYTAYGSGEKPRIYGSPEDGVKIWKFHTTLQDCGGIIVEPDVTFELDESGGGPAQQEDAVGELRIECNVHARRAGGRPLRRRVHPLCGFAADSGQRHPLLRLRLERGRAL